MSQRAASRLGFMFRQHAATLRTPFRSQKQQSRRYADAATQAAAGPEQSGFSKFLNSEVGPKTVHFWAPIMKWGVVLAGAADFFRPASSLSIPQNAALMATGLIWTRWCFVIKPRNLFLASVNFMLFSVGATQVTRAVLYQRGLKGDSVGDEIKEAAQEGKAELKAAVKKAENAVKKA